ncbi:MAG: Rieske 2Fe-2S domain-containing protein [Mycobacterium sp.]|nr:Rieske 2Fe-2S domain-containing protein [Mycobacterium sp.]
MSATRGFPFDHHPRGWYQVAWSAELKAEDVHPCRYFGNELVIYRSTSGQVVVLDAHCLHMGAHLGHGGKVTGEQIVCPFHGWKWDCDGSNAEIPYSRQKPIAKRLRSWTVLEQSGLVLVWFDHTGRPPDFRPPAITEFEAREYYPVFPYGARQTTAKVVPQLLLENAIDFPHLEHVHGWRRGTSGLEKYEPHGRSFEIVSYGAIETSHGPAHIRADTTAWGVSLVFSHMTGLRDLVFFSSVTPIDDERSEIRLSITAKRKEPGSATEPDSFAKAMIEAQASEVIGTRDGGDLDIWEHMVYRTQPPLVREEAEGMRALRKWAANFYDRAPTEPAKTVKSRTPATARATR